MIRNQPGWDKWLDQMAAGKAPIFPTMVSEKTGKDELPYVPIRAVSLDERRLELFNKEGPLTQEEWAEFAACEAYYLDEVTR